MPELRKSFSTSKILKIVEFAELDGNRLAGRHFEVANLETLEKKQTIC